MILIWSILLCFLCFFLPPIIYSETAFHYFCFLQAGERVEVIHLRSGFVITTRAHHALKRVIGDLIRSIDDEDYKAAGVNDADSERLLREKKARIYHAKRKLVQLFVSAIFPGPTADIIVAEKRCPFTNER